MVGRIREAGSLVSAMKGATRMGALFIVPVPAGVLDRWPLLTQRGGEILVRVFETRLDALQVRDLAVVHVLERSSNRLKLPHAVGNFFPLNFTPSPRLSPTSLP